jgi:hypothetical protein
VNVPEAIDPLLTPAERLLTCEPERSDVSVLGETHTADTAPATLPEPLLDDPATSSPAPPSDVFLRSAEPAPVEPEPLLAPLDTPALPDSAPRSLGGPARARRGPYWEWALLGFSGTLLVVAMVMRQRGLPLLSAGPERSSSLIVRTAPLRPEAPSSPPPALELAPLPASVPIPVPASSATSPPTSRQARKRAPKSPRRRADAIPVAAPAQPAGPRPERVPARDSVRAGLAQDLP